MKPLTIIYWSRFGFGLLAAVICTLYGIATGTITSDPSRFPLNILFNGISLALIVYIISYYVVKFKFRAQVEKPSKLLSTGIGIYFLSWIVFWVLFYTILAGQPVPPTP
jgi:hypothetical protein